MYGGDDNKTGFDCKPFIGKYLHDVMPRHLADDFLSHIKNAINLRETQSVKYKFDEDEMIELPNHVVVPKEIWFEGIIKHLPIVENGERVALWIAKNITQQHYLELELKTLSEIDELTGILNRRAFSNTLKTYVQAYPYSGEPFSLIMYDIDLFKRVNDTLGHTVGDEVIQHVVKVFRSELDGQVSFGRIGGEEFAILLPHKNIQGAYELAERLRQRLEKSPCETELYEIDVTVSMGVTQVNKDDQDTLALISRADKAMYQAKKEGRNRTCKYSNSSEREYTQFNQCNWFKKK
ncbi:GGDEF domain-containing protein [Marinomonas atlantica]|uniref:GGDEF domain-containing protein n=1 Tax=Marinomonas atlantica TaxID=1806668 RepID=UPI0018D2F7AC|nr:GGDEF domain-containing protein [Marinomonas atlantica]